MEYSKYCSICESKEECPKVHDMMDIAPSCYTKDTKLHDLRINKNDLPIISDDDLLLYIEDKNEECCYRNAIGYYRGIDNNNKPLFDNTDTGWIYGNVLAWCNIQTLEPIKESEGIEINNQK